MFNNFDFKSNFEKEMLLLNIVEKLHSSGILLNFCFLLQLVSFNSNLICIKTLCAHIISDRY